MDGGVGGEFGVEGGGEDVILLDEGGRAFVLGEDGDVGSDFFDDGAANENHFEWFFLQGGVAEENVAGELAAVAVAKDGHVEELERILRGIFDVVGEEDGSGTGAKDSAAFAGVIADGVVETFFLEELELRGAFAAGENEAVAAVEIGDGADFDGLCAEFVKHGGVGVEVALDGQDANFHWTILRFGAWRHF